jgi:SHS2 domain-containing protein
MKVYTEVEHTADYSILVRDRELPGLFRQAVHAVHQLCGLQVDESESVQRTIVLHAPDMEDLLVAWLEELLFDIETARQAWVPLEIQLTGFDLDARVDCFQIKNMSREIKAVTYHQLEVRRTGEIWEAAIVFDV